MAYGPRVCAAIQRAAHAAHSSVAGEITAHRPHPWLHALPVQ
jgi:hypothetical protein